jgi:transcriptional regulator of acetoin/glycerol metabolism
MSTGRSSALYQPVQFLLPDLAAVAADEYVVAITDPYGKILFSLGGPHMRRAAERVNFVPGGRWDEASVGTNTLDLALRTAWPQQGSGHSGRPATPR